MQKCSCWRNGIEKTGAFEHRCATCYELANIPLSLAEVSMAELTEILNAGRKEVSAC